MEFLIHIDLLIDGVLSSSPSIENILKLSQKQSIKLWTLSSSLSSLHQKLIEKSFDPDRLACWLNNLKVLPLTGREMKAPIFNPHDRSDSELISRIVKSFNLKGVLTLNPDFFSMENVNAWKPESLPDILASHNSEIVPMVNLPASYHAIWEDLEDAFAKVIRGGQFILGDELDELEKQIATYCQTRHAVGVSSGTDALLITLLAEEIGFGDEVLTTPYTFFATAGSISRTGAKPVFVDIDPETFNINPDDLEAKITFKTRAIIPVHLYGQCADMDPILEIAKKRDLTVIEDAAQAIGSELDRL